MGEIELDLTRPALQRPELDLDLNTPHWQQTDVRAEFGEIDMTRPEPSEATQSYELEQAVVSKPAPIGIKPARPESTITVRPELVEGGTLPSVAEFTAVKLAEELGYTEVLTVGALEDGIRFYQQRTAEACLELGKRLLLLKELSAHGEFTKRIELLGFSQASVRRFMGMTRKFTKTSRMDVLIPKVGTQQKLIELLILDDDEVEELADGKEVKGVTLDEIECMSATELRKALRKYKDGDLPEEAKKPLVAEIENLHKKIDNHEKAFSKLQAEKETVENKLTALTVKKHPGKDLVSVDVQAVREEAFALEYGVRTYTDGLRALFTKTLNNHTSSDTDRDLQFNAIAIAASSALANVDELFREIQDAFGISDFPPVLSGRHILTEEERDRLDDSKAMIDHKFNVDKTLREARREEENKRGAGRPAGSLNKK